MSGIKKTITKIWNWYRGLPWYWKVLGAVVLIFLVLLLVLSLFQSSMPDHSKSDKAHAATTDAAIKGLEGQNDEITKVITTKKKEIATKLNQAGKIDAATLVSRKRIESAATMEELDALQKELGL